MLCGVCVEKLTIGKREGKKRKGKSTGANPTSSSHNDINVIWNERESGDRRRVRNECKKSRGRNGENGGEGWMKMEC